MDDVLGMWDLGVKGRSFMQITSAVLLGESQERVQSRFDEQNPCKFWCAVHTRYQHETSVESLLTLKGFETFLPMYIQMHAWKDRKKQISRPLFPGYVFVADIDEGRLHVVSTPGVCAVVSVAGVPAKIASEEIESIRRAVSNPYAVEPHHYLREGDHVRVVRGPLEGVEGILLRKKSSVRLIVSLELLGRAAAVEIDDSCVEHLEAPRRIA